MTLDVAELLDPAVDGLCSLVYWVITSRGCVHRPEHTRPQESSLWNTGLVAMVTTFDIVKFAEEGSVVTDKRKGNWKKSRAFYFCLSVYVDGAFCHTKYACTSWKTCDTDSCPFSFKVLDWLLSLRDQPQVQRNSQQKMLIQGEWRTLLCLISMTWIRWWIIHYSI